MGPHPVFTPLSYHSAEAGGAVVAKLVGANGPNQLAEASNQHAHELIAQLDDRVALSVTERVVLINAITDLAMAGERERVEQFAETLSSWKEQSAAHAIAFSLFSCQLAIRNEAFELAAQHFTSGHRLALNLGREAEAAAFCLALGAVSYRRGEYANARERFEEAIVASRRAGSRQMEGRALMNLGLVLKNSGDLREAERLLRHALRLATEEDSPTGKARSELNLATLLLRRGQLVESASLAGDSATVFTALGFTGHAVLSRIAEARALRCLGESLHARARLESIVTELRGENEPRTLVLALEFLGDCDLDLGNHEASRERYREALLLARGHGKATDLVLECLRGLAAAELACGEAKNAHTLIEESVAIAREQGDTFELGTSLYVLANVLNSLAESSAAVSALEEARQIGNTIGDDHGFARASLALARHALAEGRRVDAMTLAAESHRLFQRIGAEHLIAEAGDVLAEISGGADATGPTTEPAKQRARRPTTRQIESAEPIIPGFLTVDSATKQMLGIVRSLAPRRLNILVLGESGTGKELIAQAVHIQSGRTGPFVPINCSAFPGDLIEGELFGHARGAYTGADRERVGLFEFAHQGTLFLDEIGDMPFKAQARLLRALEGGEVRRLGENTARVVDVRVVAATHRGLPAMVAAGEFRLDLYHRLAGYVVQLSPVRERPEDAKLLIDHFLAKFAREQEKTITLTPELREEMAGHSWPGNVREIRLVMERLVALTADGAELRRLPFVLEGAPRPRSLPEALEAEERRRVLDALHSHNWNKQRAANSLGTSRTTLIAKMQRMGIAVQKP